MQNFELAMSASHSSFVEGYSVRQRLLSASLSLAMTSSVTVTCALANTPAPTFTPVHLTSSSFTHALLGHSAAAPTHSPTIHHTTLHPVGNWLNRSSGPAIFGSKNVVQNAVNQATGSGDLNLASSTPLFQAGGLAGFHSIILDIGGKQQQFSLDSKLTASELVAAQQVLSGGKQTITINSSGIATGGSFNLNSSTLSALDNALGGSVGSLVISHGVRAFDSLGNLNLSGSLVDLGSLIVGAGHSAKGQTVDMISAANIYNGQGGVISSATSASGLSATGISLSTPGTFYNSGTVSSSSTLNISAPTISNVSEGGAVSATHSPAVISAAQNVNLNTQSLTNSGLIASASGNVNIVNGGGNNNIVVAGAGGTLQVDKGNINFNESGNKGSGNITLSGGDYLSQQLNLNAGTGAIQANVGEVTGVVNGSADSSHITTATNNMQLGNICVSGDPTYFNTRGNITITGSLTGDPNLAIIASGNIIANAAAGATIDTSAKTANTNGGDILMVAGAHFSSDGGSGSGTTTSSGDTSTTLTLTDSTSSNKGSASGGYIDLSGRVITGSKTNTAITAINAGGNGTGTDGNVTLVALKGSEQNSGDIAVASNSNTSVVTITTTGGTPSKDGSTGKVSLLGAGGLLYAQSVVTAGNVSITGAVPSLSGGTMTIKDGNVSGASFTPGTTLTVTETAMFNSIIGGSLTINTAGLIDLFGVTHAQSATLTSTKNFVEGFYLSTAGAGGVSGSASQNGANGGDININAVGIFVSFIDSSGGGGAGGSSATGQGGDGGNAGNVTLNATGNNIASVGYLNASGGGGGGGAGANAGVLTANIGGQGGKAGIITIKTPFAYVGDQDNFGYTILDFNGAGGGAGGLGTGSIAGGGGGGAPGFGGGGGGGAAGLGNGSPGNNGGGGGGAFTFLGGGGGGAQTTAATTSATGGNGGSSTTTVLNGLGQPTMGGAGGISIGGGAKGAAGLGGFSDISKGIPGTGVGGGGGGFSGIPGTSGAGGGQDGGGIAGGGVTNPGKNGGITTLQGGNGQVFLTVGANTGTAAKVVGIDTTQITIKGTKVASIFLGNGGEFTDLKSATLIPGSTLGLQESHQVLIVDGPITGAAVIDLAGGTGVQLNQAITATSAINISAGIPNTVGGNIVGPGTITAPTVNLSSLSFNSFGGNITAEVKASSVSAVETVGTNGVAATINLTVDTSGGKATNITGGGTGVNGIFNLIAQGTGTIGSTGAIKGPTININSSVPVGTAAKPFLTNTTGTLTVNESTSNPVFISDANVATMTLQSTSASGGSISVISAAKTFNVNNLNYANITLKDTSTTAGATMVLASAAGSQVGSGFSVVSITSAAATITTGAGSGIVGASVLLDSTVSTVGTSGSSVAVSTPVLTVTALGASGAVFVNDSQAAVLNAGGATSTYSVTSAGLTVGGAITGDKITLTDNSATAPLIINANIGTSKSSSVSLVSDDGISQTNTMAVVSGLAVSFKGNSGNIGSASQSIFTKASTTLSITGAAAASNFINQNGKATLVASSDSASGTGTLNLVDASALSVTGAVSFGTVNISAPSVAVIVSGVITTSDLTITAPVVTINPSAGSGIVITGATGSASFLSGGTLSITGADNSISISPGQSLTLGNAAGPGIKATTSITLGDSKTGAGDPLKSVISSGTGATNLTINTTGTFTSSLSTISLSSQSTGGKLDVNAKSLVFLNNPSFNPISFLAPGTTSGGTVILNLSGTQAVTLNTAVGSAKTGAPYEIATGAGSGGTVDVTVAGNLNVVTAASVSTGPASNVTLSGAKGLAVADATMLTSGYQNITLSSGSTSPFIIGGGSGVLNGTAGNVDAANISINAAGTITTAAVNNIVATASTTFSNNMGVLTMTGIAGGIVTGGVLNLGAKSGIVLGDSKTGLNDPLTSDGKSLLPTLQSLTINAGSGAFTSGISSFVMDATNSNNKLSLTAADVVVAGGPVAGQLITLKTDSTAGAAGILTLNLTGTQAVTLDTAAQASAKTPTYLISNNGTAGAGTTSISTAGVLTDNLNGVTVATGSNLDLSGGKGLVVNDATLLSSGNIANLTLASGGTTPLLIGAGSGSVNAINSDIKAGNVTVTDLAGITVDALAAVRATATGSKVDFETKNFVNNGLINGSGDPLSTITFGVGSKTGSNGISISADPNNASFGGFLIVDITANGGINLGNLFQGSLLFNGLNSVSISTPGALTFSATNPNINVATDGSITVNAGSLVSKAAGPIVFTAPSATGSSISITTKSAITVGSTKGDISINNAGGGNNIVTLTSAGTLAINTALSANAVNLYGSSVVVNASVSGANTVVQSTSSSGAITTTGGAIIGATSTLTIGEVNTTLAKFATNIDAPTIQLGGVLPSLSSANGALFLNNSSGGTSAVSGLNAIAALNYSAVNAVNVGSVFTTKGGINITSGGTLAVSAVSTLSATGGGIDLVTNGVSNVLSVGNGGQLLTSGGSITLENNSTTILPGSIVIGTGVTMHASATAKGVGQVSIVMGPVPVASQLSLGVVPITNPPTIINTGGGTVTFSVIGDSTGTIVSNGPGNVLNAAGRNVVFYDGNSNNGAIVLQGNDTIIADPPVAAVGAAIAPVSTGSAVVVSPAPSASHGSALSPINFANALSTTSSIFPTNSIFQNNSGAAINAEGFSAVTGSNALTGAGPSIVSATGSAGGASSNSTTASTLLGKVSNTAERNLEQGPMLIAPDVDTIVRTGFGTVDVKARSVVLIVAFEGGVAVYNLHDNKQGSVVISGAGHRLAVAPGRNALLTKRDVHCFEQVNPAEFVGYRGMTGKAYSDGVKTFQSEFDVRAMLHGVAPLRQLVHASDAHSRKVTKSLLKTTAILMSLGDPTGFAYMVAPRMTAMGPVASQPH